MWVVSLLAVVHLHAAEPPATSVLEAAKSGDMNALRAAIAQGNINASAADGMTALHWAVRRGDLNAVDLLLKAGAKTNAATRYGVTPLSLAAQKGNAALIERLLKAGAGANSAMPDGETALMTAARSGDPEAINVLAAHGAEIDARQPENGQTALMWAASANNAAAVKTLLELGAHLNARSLSGGQGAGRAGARVSGGYSPYLYAVRSGAMDAARVLLDAGVDVNETTPDGTSALVLTTINAHYELAAMLLDYGADPNAAGQGWTALHELTYAPHTNTGSNDPGAEPTGKMSYLELARKLVAHGADINARQTKEASIQGRQIMNRIGATPFLLASKDCDVPLMKTFIELGADPMLMTVEEDTPLMAASGVGLYGVGENPGTNDEALEAVKYIFSLGDDVARVNAISTIGNTALHGAVVRGSTAIIQLLADKGAKLDVRNKPDRRYDGGTVYDNVLGGWTPLEMADGVIYTDTFKQDIESAKLLRKLLAERGLPVPDPVYVNNKTGVAIVREIGAAVKDGEKIVTREKLPEPEKKPGRR
jgi:ankyrin repeat protein